MIGMVHAVIGAEDSEIRIEVNFLKLPYFKLGVYMNRYYNEMETEDLIVFGFIFFSLEFSFYRENPA